MLLSLATAFAHAAPHDPLCDGAHDAALIVAIEDYALLPDVPGALAEADAWAAWLTRTRRIPAANVVVLRDDAAVDRAIAAAAARAASRVRPGGVLWVAFVGHASMSIDGRDALLVGMDAEASFEGLERRSARLSDLFGGFPAGSRAFVVIDAPLGPLAAAQGWASAGVLPVAFQPKLPEGVAVVYAGGPETRAQDLPHGTDASIGALVRRVGGGPADGDGDGAVTVTELVTWVAAANSTGGRFPALERRGGDVRIGCAAGAEEPGTP